MCWLASVTSSLWVKWIDSLLVHRKYLWYNFKTEKLLSEYYGWMWQNNFIIRVNAMLDCVAEMN